MKKSADFGDLGARNGMDLEDLEAGAEPMDQEVGQKPIRVLFEDELRDGPQAEWVVPGLFRLGELVFLSGPPGTGKSLFSLGLAARLAGGLQPDLALAAPKRPQRVILIAAEGGKSEVYRRLQAWKRLQDVPDSVRAAIRKRLGFIPRPVDLGSEDEVQALADDLLTAIEGKAPDLVIVDTFSACTPGADENDRGPMTDVIDRVRRLLQLGEMNPAVLFVHHGTKSGDNPLRGSSAIEAAADMVIAVQRKAPKRITLSCHKANRIPGFDSQMLEIVRYDFLDEDGRPEVDGFGIPVTSAVILPAEKETKEPKATQETAPEQVAEVVLGWLRTYFDEPPSQRALTQKFKSEEPLDLTRDRFHELLDEAVAAKLLRVIKGRGKRGYLYFAPDDPRYEQELDRRRRGAAQTDRTDDTKGPA